MILHNTLVSIRARVLLRNCLPSFMACWAFKRASLDSSLCSRDCLLSLARCSSVLQSKTALSLHTQHGLLVFHLIQIFSEPWHTLSISLASALVDPFIQKCLCKNQLTLHWWFHQKVSPPVIWAPSSFWNRALQLPTAALQRSLLYLNITCFQLFALLKVTLLYW